MILLVADLADLKANPTRWRRARWSKRAWTGPRSASVLVQNGTLHEGDLFIAGTVDGKVRAMFRHMGRKVKRPVHPPRWKCSACRRRRSPAIRSR